tara:strand:+ start:91 stop:375 length:285 start_codon:yes stop_codon:yes gene_type:complete
MTLTWDKANFTWNNNSNLWNDVNDVISSIEGRSKANRKKDKKLEEKKRKVIRLVMERRGIKVYDETKEIQNIEIYLDDIKIIAEEIKRNVQIIH